MTIVSNTKNCGQQDDDSARTAKVLRHPNSRTLNPTDDAPEETPGRLVTVESLEGQLGPDEISEPDEVIKNHEAKLHP